MTTNARLRVLVQLAECGSVRGAAEALHVTESSVSAALTALARDVGVELLAKDGRGVRLTAAGSRYAGYARTILGLHAEALVAARGQDDPGTGLVRLAAVTTAGEHLLPQLLVSFRRDHPRVDVNLEVRSRAAVWPMLAHHEVDLVFAGRPPDGVPGRIRARLPNSLVVVGAPAVVAEFAPERATWLLREPGSGTRATCLALLSGLDVDPARLTLGSHGAVIAGAVAGLGVALVSRQAVEPLLREGGLAVAPVPGTPLPRPWHLVTADRTTATAELLVEHVLATPGWAA